MRRRITYQWVAMLALLVTELAVLARLAPQARLLFYGTDNLPLAKIVVSLLGLGVLYSWFSAGGSVVRPGRFSRPALAVHLGIAATLTSGASMLGQWSLKAPWYIAFAVWCLVGGLFLLSWLNILVPPGEWASVVVRHAPWVGGFLFLAVSPGLTRLSSAAWEGKMRAASFEVSSTLLSLIFDDVVIKPEEKTMGVPGFTIYIAASCSGYEGMGLMTLFLGFYFFLRRSDLVFPRALWLVPIGLVASWLGNCVRLASLVMVGAWVSKDVAVGVFHSYAGWIAFILLCLALIWLVEHLGLFQKDAGHNREFPPLPYLLPITVQLLLTLILSAFQEEVDLAYPVRLVVVCAVLWAYRGSYTASGLYAQPTVSACALGALVYIVWVWMIPEKPAESPLELLPGSLVTLWLLSRLLGAVIVVPVIEELAFRGYLLRRLQSRWFDEVPLGQLTLASVLLSSLAFGLLHQAWVAGVVAGVAYALATRIRGNLNDPVVAHATTNLCLALHVAYWQRWDLW